MNICKFWRRRECVWCKVCNTSRSQRVWWSISIVRGWPERCLAVYWCAPASIRMQHPFVGRGWAPKRGRCRLRPVVNSISFNTRMNMHRKRQHCCRARERSSSQRQNKTFHHSHRNAAQQKITHTHSECLNTNNGGRAPRPNSITSGQRKIRARTLLQWRA